MVRLGHSKLEKVTKHTKLQINLEFNNSSSVHYSDNNETAKVQSTKGNKTKIQIVPSII